MGQHIACISAIAAIVLMCPLCLLWGGWVKGWLMATSRATSFTWLVSTSSVVDAFWWTLTCDTKNNMWHLLHIFIHVPLSNIFFVTELPVFLSAFWPAKQAIRHHSWFHIHGYLTSPSTRSGWPGAPCKILPEEDFPLLLSFKATIECAYDVDVILFTEMMDLRFLAVFTSHPLEQICFTEASRTLATCLPTGSGRCHLRNG